MYLAICLLVGIRSSGGQNTTDGFFVAGRSMGSCAIGISVLAALFSGISFLGAPAYTYEHGIAFILVLVSFGFATPITNFIFVPFFIRTKITSGYEYLELRFDGSVRSLAAALFIFRVVFYLGVALYAPALALKSVTGLPVFASIALTGVLSCIYTVHGGMLAVIWTDIFQFCVLFSGLVFMSFWVVETTPGGSAKLWQVASNGGKLDLDWSIDLASNDNCWNCILGGVGYNLVQLATDQISIQRYISASSLKEAQNALWLKLVLNFPVAGVAYVVGVLIWAYYHLDEGDAMAGTGEGGGTRDRLLADTEVGDWLGGGDRLGGGGRVLVDGFVRGTVPKLDNGDEILPYFAVHELPPGE
jgi:sodium-coupled monocarboxylate transporter 8/12